MTPTVTEAVPQHLMAPQPPSPVLWQRARVGCTGPCPALQLRKAQPFPQGCVLFSSVGCTPERCLWGQGVGRPAAWQRRAGSGGGGRGGILPLRGKIDKLRRELLCWELRRRLLHHLLELLKGCSPGVVGKAQDGQLDLRRQGSGQTPHSSPSCPTDFGLLECVFLSPAQIRGTSSPHLSTTSCLPSPSHRDRSEETQQWPHSVLRYHRVRT